MVTFISAHQENDLNPGDPVHAADGHQDEDDEDGHAEQSEVIGPPERQDAGEAVDVLDEHVQEGLTEADRLHGGAHRVGQRQHDADGASELGTFSFEKIIILIYQQPWK